LLPILEVMPIRPPDALLPSFHAQPTILRAQRSTLAVEEPLTQGSLAVAREVLQDLDSLDNHDRYTITSKLGTGSTSQVFRVRDLLLERNLAMKVLRPEHAHDNEVRERFLSEARTMARLQHPGILPVYDVGELSDGRPYFTMQEVSGENLGQLLHRRHQMPELADLWTIPRLLTVFRQACAIVAFAHARDTLHLDLKPENLLIGEQDAVYVVDWGLTSAVGSRSQDLAGTPAFMAPELLDLTAPAADARVDVYALGAVLYQILAGTPPYTGSPEQVLRQVQAAPPVALQTVKPSVPGALSRIVEQAMARSVHRRFETAKELGQAVDTWLDGTETRKRVHRLVELAASRVDDARLLSGQAGSLRSRAERMHAEVRTWDAEETKYRLWDLEDRAELLEREARFKLLERRQLLHAATTQAPEMAEPRAALAECFREDHDLAESRGDEAARRMAEERLREHLSVLPETHPIRREYLSWLQGSGALSVSTSVPGASIFLERYAHFRRRMRVVPVRLLGEGAVQNVPLPMGNYRLRVSAPGHADVYQPVRIARGEHWRNARSAHSPALPIHLPATDDLGEDDCYVPGGDALIADCSGEMTTVWVEGFVIRKNPVTNSEYLAFLNDLVERGDAVQARRWAPRLHVQGRALPTSWQQGHDQTYELPLADELVWRPDAPVVGVSWSAAMAFAAWESERTGHAWRLPHEVEWEKAARGVDGRRFPWGGGADPARACIWSSRETPDGPASVQSFTADESPYGCRHLAGNVHEWCANLYLPVVPIQNGMPAWPTVSETTHRAARGASWRSRGLDRALCQRQGLDPEVAEDRVGFRLARSMKC
jgi:formylglycine-generating enzyme required for sulfatase activity/tRNA A-37 threonylcarbamoyl transferase component Bud32